MSKFDSSMFEMQFKQSLGNSQSKSSKSGLNSSKTHQSVNMMNQTNIAFMKQQIMQSKKATNLLLKGLSPLKK